MAPYQHHARSPVSQILVAGEHPPRYDCEATPTYSGIWDLSLTGCFGGFSYSCCPVFWSHLFHTICITAGSPMATARNLLGSEPSLEYLGHWQRQYLGF